MISTEPERTKHVGKSQEPARHYPAAKSANRSPGTRAFAHNPDRLAFGIDKGRRTRLFLHLGSNHLQAERRLARRFRPVNFDHFARAASRQRRVPNPGQPNQRKPATGSPISARSTFHDRTLAELLFNLRQAAARALLLLSSISRYLKTFVGNYVTAARLGTEIANSADWAI